jgi:hypothetical protein
VNFGLHRGHKDPVLASTTCGQWHSSPTAIFWIHAIYYTRWIHIQCKGGLRLELELRIIDVQANRISHESSAHLVVEL